MPHANSTARPTDSTGLVRAHSKTVISPNTTSRALANIMSDGASTAAESAAVETDAFKVAVRGIGVKKAASCSGVVGVGEDDEAEEAAADDEATIVSTGRAMVEGVADAQENIGSANGTGTLNDDGGIGGSATAEEEEEEAEAEQEEEEEEEEVVVVEDDEDDDDDDVVDADADDDWTRGHPCPGAD
jgi:hypothetical protein